MWKQKIWRPRLRVILGSSWRNDPAAAFRGFAKVGSPARSRSALSSAKRDFERYTSPRTSMRFGHPLPASRSGMSRTVRRLAVTSSPSIPLPRVAPVTSTPSS